MPDVVGVDGWKKGWVAVRTDGRRFLSAASYPDFSALVADTHDAAVLGVDMPLGLAEEGLGRTADDAARAFLGARRSTLFPVPPRVVVQTGAWPEALARAQRTWGKGISKQTFALFPKILEVDRFADDARIVEVHPEVSFQLLKGAPLPPKRTWAGQLERLELLRGAGLDLPADLGSASVVPADDVLDATAAAWTAARVAAGTARSFPDPATQRDRSGRLIAILG